MIYDKIENIGKYKGISEWFDAAADFLLKTDLSALPMGRTPICGDNVFVNVMEADTAEPEKNQFEIHKKYWDIQLDIEGTECVQIGLNPERETVSFDADRDFGTVSCTEFAACTMGPGRFIICMQEEPHKPTLRYGAECSGKVKKCVVKVRV